MTGRTEELGDVAVWTSGGTPPRGLSEYWSGTIPWISAATLRESHISTSTQFLTTSGVEAGSKIAPTGSTLILVRGMALHHELRVGIATRDLAFNQDVKALIPLPFVEPEFLTYAILGKTPEILSLVSSAGSGTGVLNSDRLKKIQIWIPSRDEQICVVSRINDLDVLVGSLAATIAKKRAIKQGMMQELLTGRTRLSGYTGLWRRVLFSDIVTPVSERLDPGRAIGRVVELEHLSQSTGELVGYSDVRSTESLKTSFHSGDVLGKLRAYLRKFWLADFDGFCSTEIWALRPIPKVSDGAFIRYVVEEDAFIEAASTSYGTHMPRSDWRVVWLFPDEGVAHVARRAGASVAG
ncbi:restriction endonuclease subunit S [Acidipropionibacterium acidipropionici]|uniref:restriction endonuclease subunit S n=1 Tax=Acidipropionibacterium acidipropionici TaxID=1748 RepID=UPI000973960F|nr:restriction endonuclease subunit S [Acidipropionibacterium acidipropionici]APZ08248.1 hypothetical protein BWX38_02040 [Acidipropionibacterium acidipropionici]